MQARVWFEQCRLRRTVNARACRPLRAVRKSDSSIESIMSFHAVRDLAKRA
jgi:hypothetical protein